MSAWRRIALVLGGTAVLSAATIAKAVLATSLPLVPLAFAVYLALAIWAVLARPSRSGDGLRRGRSGAVALAIALVAALVDRHQVVASRGVAPDDVAVALMSLILLALAVRAPQLAARPVVLAGALAAYALIGVAHIAGAPYSNDSIATVHRAAELFASGADPYRSLDTLESLERFGLDQAFATHLQDGTPLRSFSYPALAVLLPAPFVAAGLEDLRALYLTEVLAASLAATAAVGVAWRPLVLAAVVGNVAIARQHVALGVDPTWAILLGAALLVLDRARRDRRSGVLLASAVLLGLACASRQTAWFAAPFALAAVAGERDMRSALRYGSVAAAAFLVPALPFLAVAPGAYLRSVLAPMLLPLEPYGIGLSGLGAEGLLPLFERGAYAGFALVALAAAVWLSVRRRPAAVGLAVLALAPVYLAWRALQNYLTFVGPFAALAVAREEGAPTTTTVHEPVLSRQSLEVHDAR